MRNFYHRIIKFCKSNSVIIRLRERAITFVKLCRSIYIISALIEIVRSKVWILEGLEVSTHNHLKVIFAGSEWHKNYFVNCVFKNICTESYVGRKYFWQLYYLIRKNICGCSLAIIEGDFIHRYVYENKKDFFIPIWLKSRADIPLLAVNRSSKEDLRRIKKHRLEYLITKASDQLEDFYYHMYLPTVNSRHQERTIAMGYHDMMQKVQKGCCELLLVTKEGVAIAGVLIVTNERTPRLWANGIRDGNSQYWKDGAIAATYFFSSHYLAKHEYKEMHMGLLRSFLRDGVLRYKNKWNIHVAAADGRGFIIKPLRISKGLEGFLINNPFVYSAKSHLNGAVFFTDEKSCSPDNLELTNNGCPLNGLSELNVFYINKFYDKVGR